jgi:hypothetical protein
MRGNFESRGRAGRWSGMDGVARQQWLWLYGAKPGLTEEAKGAVVRRFGYLWLASNETPEKKATLRAGRQ